MALSGQLRLMIYTERRYFSVWCWRPGLILSPIGHFSGWQTQCRSSARETCNTWGRTQTSVAWAPATGPYQI